MRCKIIIFVSPIQGLGLERWNTCRFDRQGASVIRRGPAFTSLRTEQEEVELVVCTQIRIYVFYNTVRAVGIVNPRITTFCMVLVHHLSICPYCEQPRADHRIVEAGDKMGDEKVFEKEGRYLVTTGFVRDICIPPVRHSIFVG